LESYFTLEAIKKSVADIPETVIELDYKKSVDEQLGTIDRSIKSKNSKIIKSMTLDDIKDSDLYSFCLKIKQFLERTNHMSNSGS
jgi:hypothetical protein